MTRRRIRAAAVAIVAAIGLAGCGDDGGDLEAFCAAVDELRDDDPFEGLAIASPGEMRDAFDRLAAGAEAIDDAAPDELSVQADRFRRAVETLRDRLSAAGYDPRAVDSLTYGAATRDYADAAVALDNSADAACG